MISKVVRAATLLLTTLAIPVTVLIAPLPASADTTGSMCETYSPFYCLNTANFSSYTDVTESGTQARTIVAVPQNGSYLLQFKGAPSMCVAARDIPHWVEVKPCNGSNGVYWTKGSGGEWINQYASQYWGRNYYLTGLGGAGFSVPLMYWQEESGALQRWQFN